MKKKLLWVGDACVETGFARATHHILEGPLSESWEIVVLGVNHRGDPHPFAERFKTYPTDIRDPFGVHRLGALATKERPDVIFIITDPWHIPKYLDKTGNVPVVASLAVDGMNCRGRGLNGLAGAIFWTEFGLDEAAAGGYRGKAAVIPLGVDLDTYQPRDKAHARKALKLPPMLHEEGFIVGNINRNQPRKRLDLTLAWFAEWVHSKKIEDAYLYLHLCPTNDQGWDIHQLAEYYGIAARLIFAEPAMGQGVSELQLAHTYAAFDCQVTTTQGEGFGLTTLEGMACGTPQIVPTWASLAEICGDAALQVPCTEIAHTPNMINAMGALPNKDQWIGCLDRLYREPAERERLSAAGLSIAQQPCYRWANISAQVDRVIHQALDPTSTRIIHGQEQAGGGRQNGEETRPAGEELP